MELLLRRRWSEGNATIGELFVDDIWQCYTLEDVVRGTAENIADVKILGKTAIPAGRYRITITYSKRFKRMLPELHDVPSFTASRIHNGCTDEDTEGCILVGEYHEFARVTNSKVALNELLTKMGIAQAANEDFWITIYDRVVDINA